MTLEVEINFCSSDFDKVLKWYSLAFKGKHPNKEDERVFNKLSVLTDSLRQDEKEEEKDDD